MSQVVSSRLSIKQRRRRRLFIFAGVLGALMVALFLFLWWLSCASFLQITSVEVSGEQVVPASALGAAVEHELEGAYLGVFSKRNIFLYSKKSIEKELLLLFPTLKSASINAKDFHTIAVVVSERAPAALWCGTERAGVGEECLLLDVQGLAYANAPHYSGVVYQTYYGPLPPGPLPKQFLTQDSFRSILALVDTLSKKNTPDTVEYISVDAADDVRVVFSGGYEILFERKDDTGSLFERFSLALTAVPFTEHTLSDFEYIDLRFGDKVYYKLKAQ